MSNKKYEHWNDKYHDDNGTEHSKIEELAGEIYNELEKYLLEDIEKVLKEDFKEEPSIKKNHILRRFYRLMDNVEAMRGAAVAIGRTAKAVMRKQTNSLYRCGASHVGCKSLPTIHFKEE